MRKFLVLFSFIPILLISFFSLGAMTLQQNHQSQQTAEKVRTKRSVETSINETDFINTMFLRSSFFENWSDTNYFINPTLKTSKSLTYNKKWYLDFLKDSYSTGVSYDKPSDKFMDLYKNWDNYANQYSINKFYNVDKKQFLKELTNFSYSFAKYFNTVEVINKLEKSVDNLQSVNLIEDNWKLMSQATTNRLSHPNYLNIADNKNYIFIYNNDIPKNYKIIKIINDGFYYPSNILKFVRDHITAYSTYWNAIVKTSYCWNGIGEPQTPTIDRNTGEITNWSVENQKKVKDFLNNYLDVIIQENIRVQQGGNPNYESSIVGTQRIIFDFEIIDESERYTAMYFIKKSIYRMILTIDKNNNIIAGSLELIHTKTASNDAPHPYKETKLGFLFTFMKEKDNIFNFDANTNSYLENGNIKYYEKMKGQIDINKFLKAFFAYALVPVFQNRSNFIESGYIDNLQYDTVLINFFGLKLVNFSDVLIDEKKLIKINLKNY